MTEPEYVIGFVGACQNPRVRVDIHDAIGVPRTIVEHAKRQKLAASEQAKGERDQNLEYDEVWCVFDVDAHPNIDQAKQMARDNDIQLAISNPCVELWLWLHFAAPPGCLTRGDMQSRMSQYIPGYNKHVRYSDYSDGYSDAVRRAKELDRIAGDIKDIGRNPTTGFWRLTESIRAGS